MNMSQALTGATSPLQPTDVERLEAELAQVRAEFQAFVYTVSHDLRAPLRHINAFAQVIEEDLPNAPTDILGHLATIRQSAQLLTQQLDGLTQLSRLGQQRVQWQAVDVLTMVQAVARDLVQHLPDHPVQWQWPQEGPLVWADADLLRQLLTHVLDNALKFSRKREPAVISLTWQMAAPSQPGLPGRCTLSLRDNGIGFAPEKAGSLFKVFAKLNPTRDYEGLGLGLVSCHRIMQRLGGHLAIEAAVDAGCCVTLSLPLAAAT